MQQDVSSSERPLPKDCSPMCQMPFLSIDSKPMRLFDPEDEALKKPEHLNKDLNFELAVKYNSQLRLIPGAEDCKELWDKYEMLPNIKAHSSKVAVFMLALAKKANARGYDINEDAAYATGMLHDLGKTYCIKYKGSHAQVGATWVMRETRNAAIARAVLLHVHFPWEEKVEEAMKDINFFLPLAVIYADKRVRHDQYVSINERFVDLNKRYGFSAYSLERIEASRQQGLLIEKLLSQKLGLDLNAYTPDYGRLVR